MKQSRKTRLLWIRELGSPGKVAPIIKGTSNEGSEDYGKANTEKTVIATREKGVKYPGNDFRDDENGKKTQSQC